MAARKKPLHPVKVENMKEKIKTTLLIKMLQDHALEDNEVSNSRIDAAKYLLSKVLSNAPTVTENESVVSVIGEIKHISVLGVSAKQK